MIGTVEYFPAGPIEIRDATIALVKALTGFANVFGNRVAPLKSDQLPLACVWHTGDRTEPWGAANTGAVSFIHTLGLAIDVMVKAGSEDQLNAEIVGLVEPLRLALLTDSSWVGLVEDITRAEVQYSYPDEGTFIYARGVLTVEVHFRSEWAPAVPNDFQRFDAAVGSDPNSFLEQIISLPGATP